MVLRKRHTAQFKAKVAIAAIEGRKTATELASEYGVHPTMVSQWKKMAIEILETGFQDHRSRTAKEQDGFDQDNLLAQIGQLKVELDWLKKSTRMFQ